MLQISWESIVAYLPVFAVLAIWNLFVLSVISKKYTNLLKKGKVDQFFNLFFKKGNSLLSGWIDSNATSLYCPSACSAGRIEGIDGNITVQETLVCLSCSQLTIIFLLLLDLFIDFLP